MVMVITGALVAIVAVFIQPAVRSYLDTAARAQLAAQTDLALRRIARELNIALPNSIRVTSTATSSTLELIPTTAAARYQTEGAGALTFGAADASFNVLGPALTMAASQQLVFYNLGVNYPDANAYADNSTSNSNRRLASNGAGSASTINFSSNPGLPVGLLSPPFRVYAVSNPITYRCDLTTGTLTRYTGYGFLAAQPDPPNTGTSALLARGVQSCSFTYSGAAVAQRAALITLQLGLQASTMTGTETISLYHAVHVDNLP